MESVESERREGTERHTEAARDRRREKIPNEKPAVSKGLFPKVEALSPRNQGRYNISKEYNE